MATGRTAGDENDRIAGRKLPDGLSEKKETYPYGGHWLQHSIPRDAYAFEVASEGEVAATARGGTSDVSAVMVTVGVSTGVGVTVAEMTMVVVTPGVAVMTTVMVMVSGVDVGVGVGV